MTWFLSFFVLMPTTVNIKWRHSCYSYTCEPIC